MEEYLKNIWYNPRHPGSFAGPSKLYQVVKREGKYDSERSKSFYKTKTHILYKRKWSAVEWDEDKLWFRVSITNGKPI